MFSIRIVVSAFASAIFANAITGTGHRCPLKISYLLCELQRKVGGFHRNLDLVFKQPLSLSCEISTFSDILLQFNQNVTFYFDQLFYWLTVDRFQVVILSCKAAEPGSVIMYLQNI